MPLAMAQKFLDHSKKERNKKAQNLYAPSRMQSLPQSASNVDTYDEVAPCMAFNGKQIINIANVYGAGRSGDGDGGVDVDVHADGERRLSIRAYKCDLALGLLVYLPLRWHFGVD